MLMMLVRDGNRTIVNYMARAKELFTWTLEFQAFKHEEVESEDESPIGDNNSHVDHQVSEDDGAGDSDGEGVSETVFGDKPLSPVNSVHNGSSKENNHGSTPHKENCTDPVTVSDHNPNVQPKVMNFSQASHINESSCGASSFRIPSAMGKEGSILDVLDGKIRVGQAMGYDMEGCSKDIERIIVIRLVTRVESFVCGRTLFLKKDSVSVADNFIALYGTWLSKNSKVLIVVIYAPQSLVLKRILWNYISGLIAQWHGESIVTGDFNEVRSEEERFGSQFNRSSARNFNNFISSAGLVKIKTEGYSYTWSHPSASKMSKLDRFLVSKGIISNFSAITRSSVKRGIMEELKVINLSLDSGVSSDDLLLKRKELNRKLYDIKQSEASDFIQKSKVRWAIEGDENSKFFHGLINKKRSQLSIRGIFVDGDWITDPKVVEVVKDTFRDHFASRFKRPDGSRIKLNMQFPNVLSSDRVVMLDGVITRAEIHEAVWGCGVNKSPGPDGFTFEFFRRFWNTIGDDFVKPWKGFLKKDTFQWVSISHLFYADDAIFIGEWSEDNLVFNGIEPLEKKITWIAWDQILASKKNGGLGVSSLHALNCALLLKWVWCLISNDGSLWSSVIKAIHGSSFDSHSVKFFSPWCSILRELQVLAAKGFDFVSHIKKQDGTEREQWNDMLSILDTVSLSSSNDRWICDLNGEGMFCVKDIRKIIDELYLPSLSDATRCNLLNRGVVMVSPLCPICGLFPEDVQHVVFHCETTKSIFCKICRWWDVEWSDVSSFADWNLWFSHIRLASKLKLVLEGVCYVAWWHIWSFRNQSIFNDVPPRRDMIFDEIRSPSFL
uniref:RNA-directed DNA polymerase, eukaryota n=1 Tax=Tanacetum cinerariifolium TaxID=118510 RepID=A0A699HPY3_TANCI|nr:RNA-directed DNA polymerase, eukaryota [Tanacetum cinerariifolium]